MTTIVAEDLILQSPLATAGCHAATAVFVAEDSATSIYALEGEVNVFSTAQMGMASEKLALLRLPQV